MVRPHRLPSLALVGLAVGVALGLTVGVAAAEPARTRVAVVNLVAEGRSPDRAIARLLTDLAAVRCAAVTDPDLRAALEAPLAASRPASALARARRSLDEARAAFAALDFPTAHARLDAVDQAVAPIAPSAPALEVLAAAQLVRGQVLHADGDEAGAAQRFRAVRALEPGRTGLDAATFPPQIVEAYAAALAATAATGEVAVVGLPAGATLRIDGTIVSGVTSVDEGLHWVAAAAAGHSSSGRWVRSRAGKRTEVRMALDALPPARRLTDLRAGLVDRAEDPAELRAAATEVAGLAAVDLVVLVRDPGGGPEAAAFDVARGALGPWGALEATRLAPAPPPSVALNAGDEADDDRAWYGRWWGRTLIVVGGAAVVGAVVYAVRIAGDDGGDAGGARLDWCFEGQACAR